MPLYADSTGIPSRLKRGFTLVEVIVAVSILAVGLAVILRYFLFVSTAVDTVETEMAAESFLQSTMDRLVIGLREKTISGEDAAGGTTVLNKHAAEWSWSFEPLPMAEEEQAASAKLHTIAVRCSWKQSGREKTARLDRYAAGKAGE